MKKITKKEIKGLALEIAAEIMPNTRAIPAVLLQLIIYLLEKALPIIIEKLKEKKEAA